MNEYTRILIEEYCESHKSKKSKRLAKLLELSYNMETFPDDNDAVFLEKVIGEENNLELKEAMQELDDFLFG